MAERKTYSKNISKPELLRLIDEWSKKSFGPLFEYRKNQKETVCDIIYSWLNGSDDVILDAPTGSGKSFIAISVAGVLSTYFGKTGYILISDLSLLEQYEKDVVSRFPDWGVLRGQQTYICAENRYPFQFGLCHLQGCRSYSEIMSRYPKCSSGCEYIVERMKAVNSPVLVCTYAFWLLQQNYVRKVSPNPPFEKRDFVICDECHKLVDIVQNFFSPRFGKEDEAKFKTLVSVSNKLDKSQLKHIMHLRSEIFAETSNERVLELLKTYVDTIKPLNDDTGSIKKDIAKMMESGDTVSKNEKAALHNCDFLNDHYSGLCDYIENIEKVGVQYMVKNDTEEGSIVFNCIDESYLMKKYFHANCESKLYMSATVGDPDVYQISISADSKVFIKMPCVFDYTNSPIFYIGEYKMSYKEKDYSFPYIAGMISKILNMYEGRRGIIQTGSYAFAKKLYDMLSEKNKNRILLYDNSTQKTDMLSVYKNYGDKVLVGPSLVEGISLDDDLCRFQIIMKVPYPSLKDKFVSAKLKFNQAWYNMATAISILQGVGRGVRNERDWCVTFILDGCFENLYTNAGTMFPAEFKSRIQVISAKALPG